MLDTHPNLRQIHIPPPIAERSEIGDATRECIVTRDLFAPLVRRQGILLCGLSESFLPFCFVRHRPEMWHVLVTRSGQGEVWNTETGSWQVCGPGFVYVTPPKTPHAYRATSEKEAWSIAWALIKPSSVSVSATHAAFFAAEGERFAASIHGLYTESLQPMTGDVLVLESWVALVRAYALRLCVLAASYEKGVPIGDPRLARVFAAVAANPAYPWTLEELAHRANLSAEHIRRLCRAEGMDSPLRRVTELRLRHAAALLSSGFYTVERAASRVGYSNPFAFSTAFKRFFGRSPGAFARKCQYRSEFACRSQ